MTILVTGGTGYVGSRLVQKLVEQGREVRLLVRDVTAARRQFPQGVAFAPGDVTAPETLPAALADVDTVIHLVAIIRERGDRTFERVNHEGTVRVVDAGKAVGVRRHLQMSALGALPDPEFPYHDSKYRAEQYVEASGLDWTIFRPSIIFGPGDQFFSALARLAKLPAPFVLPDGGKAKFQPVWLWDVVDSFLRALDDPATVGKVYELGGPEILTYKEMIGVLMDVTGSRRPLLSLPSALLTPAAFAFDKLLPKPPVTPEQLKMLRLDNSSDDSATATLIGRPPKSLREGLDYLKG
ncbi:MAG: complex I NDUFA9 subunit family protein [Thermomicrobiales bacterium]